MMQKKKIVFTTVHPAPYIDRLIKYLHLEYEIDIIYNQLSDKYKVWQDYTWTYGYQFNELSLRTIKNLVRSADFVLVGGWGSWDCIKLILLSALFRKRIAVFSDCPINVNKRSIQYWFKKLLLFKLIDYIFCATISTQEVYSKEYNLTIEKLKIFPYAVDFEEIDLNNNKKRSVELKKGNKPRIFISNSFYPRKGYNILYKIFEGLAKSNTLNNFEIKIAGIGDEYSEYKFKMQSLSSKIEFMGWLEYERYRTEMNNTDIFIHASLFEPFGIPPIDAMARGKLLIVSDGVQSTKSIIKNGFNGYTYSANDPHEITSFLERLSSDQIYEIGQNAIKTSHIHYSYEHFSTALKECLK